MQHYSTHNETSGTIKPSYGIPPSSRIAIPAAKVEAVAEMDRRADAYQVEDAALTAKIEERRRFLLDLRERRAGGHADLERLQREAEQAEAELAQAEARHEAELAEKVQLAKDTQR